MAINVPPSRGLVAVYDREAKHTIQYVCRNDHGKQYMNPDEALQVTLDTSRTGLLALRRAVKAAKSGKVVLTPPPARRLSNTDPQRIKVGCELVEPLGEHQFQLRIATKQAKHDINVPYGLVREAWVTPDDEIGLFLHVSVVMVDGDHFTFE